MEFKEAVRSQVRMKMALAGKSGAGKTLSALKLAKGLVGDPKRIGVGQTEPGRAQCYLNQIGQFKVLEMQPPFSPEAFIKVIEIAEKAGLAALILDSISDEWAGIGGALQIHQDIADTVKNSFTAWKKVTPQHDAFFNKVLASPIHIICTVRKKTDYVMEQKDGKQVPKRVGVKDIAREDTEYKWIIQFDLEQEQNKAQVSKDNTGIFQGKPPFQITEATGQAIRQWCLTGETKGVEDVRSQSSDAAGEARP